VSEKKTVGAHKQRVHPLLNHFSESPLDPA
jgi:hypothetical protein